MKKCVVYASHDDPFHLMAAAVGRCSSRFMRFLPTHFLVLQTANRAVQRLLIDFSSDEFSKLHDDCWVVTIGLAGDAQAEEELKHK